MEALKKRYQQHIATLQNRVQTLITRFDLDAILVHSGEINTAFLDDNPYPFRVNPHFKAWVPVTCVPGCWLYLDGINRPKLWYYQPESYWNKVESPGQRFWLEEIDVVIIQDKAVVEQQLQLPNRRVACITPMPEYARQLGFAADCINTQHVLDFLHYYRAFKTDYELFCLREAQKIAVEGHRAAKEAFLSGMSEFDIHLAYLTATGQSHHELPYANIVALNEHGATLHYDRQQTRAPEQARSCLIDAGAAFHGYAADISRTYVKQANSLYAQLITALNQTLLALIAAFKVGANFIEYHLQMHLHIAQMLVNFDIAKHITAEALVMKNLTSVFIPHGLGHLLGLQVHDAGGLIQDDNGTVLAPPATHTYLRCTRQLQPGMVLTVEPGFYLIKPLLQALQSGEDRHHFDWRIIETLIPYGGIRIEDNAVIHPSRVENLTRDLKLL